MIYIRPDDAGDSMYAFIPDKELYSKQGTILSTDRCYRCFAGALFLERKYDADKMTPKTALIVFHITPGSRSYIRRQKKFLLNYIKNKLVEFDVTRIARCGGRLLSRDDEFLFQEMKKKIEGGLQRTFPNVLIEGIYPNKKTYCMEMRLVNHPGDEIEVQILTGEIP